MIQMMK